MIIGRLDVHDFPIFHLPKKNRKNHQENEKLIIHESWKKNINQKTKSRRNESLNSQTNTQKLHKCSEPSGIFSCFCFVTKKSLYLAFRFTRNNDVSGLVYEIMKNVANVKNEHKN